MGAEGLNVAGRDRAEKDCEGRGWAGQARHHRGCLEVGAVIGLRLGVQVLTAVGWLGLVAGLWRCGGDVASWRGGGGGRKAWREGVVGGTRDDGLGGRKIGSVTGLLLIGEILLLRGRQEFLRVPRPRDASVCLSV